MSFDVFVNKAVDEILNEGKHFVARYHVEGIPTTDIKTLAWNLAIGQSVGNPNVRNQWETDELFEKHSCLVLNMDKARGEITIAFPLANLDWEGDGISQLLCHIMGGQMDIDLFTKCQLLDLEFPPDITSVGPKYGLSGFRKFTGQYDKPLLGSIIKPKIGLNKNQLLDMVKELVDGGTDFIKEDEIMSNPAICPLKDRVEIIANYINNCGRKVVYCFCINGDPHVVLDRARFVAEGGGNGVHVNVWSGLGVYNSIRKLNLPLFIHFQKSGDKTFTSATNPFHISWNVICKLAGMMGVDTIHAGMWGGYSSYEREDLETIMKILLSYNVTPVLSCGMHPGLVDDITKTFGTDFMANVGGAIHGHPNGTISGVRAMRQAIDGNHGTEYETAIQKWGYVE